MNKFVIKAICCPICTADFLPQRPLPSAITAVRSKLAPTKWVIFSRHLISKRRGKLECVVESAVMVVQRAECLDARHARANHLMFSVRTTLQRVISAMAGTCPCLFMLRKPYDAILEQQWAMQEIYRRLCAAQTFKFAVAKQPQTAVAKQPHSPCKRVRGPTLDEH